MLSLSKKTDYALVLLSELARKPREYVSLRALSDEKNMPYRFLAQVAKVLRGAGLTESREGAAGGYRLAKAPAKISVSDVITAVEGGVALSECLESLGGCSIAATCPMRGKMPEMQRLVLNTLKKKSISDLIAQ